MNPNQRYGQTVLGVANLLRELVLDLGTDEHQPATCGKSEAPVNLLPELTCDLAW
jgi:hypothetical protein